MFSIKSPENQVNCIYGVIRPLYLYARLIGFFPFSVKIQLNGKNSKIYFTLIDFVVLVMHLTLYAFFVYENIQHNFLENSATSPLFTFGARALLILGIVYGILFISADLCNRYKIFSIFVRCQSFDDQMKVLGSSLNYKQNRLKIHLYMVTVLVICIVFNLITFWIYNELYTIDVLVFIFPSYFLLNSVFGSVVCIYSFFLFSLKSRYCLLNENLSRLSIETPSIKFVTTPKKDTIENLMRLADLHDLLNDILVTVNRCYSIQAMLAIGVSFTFTVFCLFSCYRGWIMRTVDEQKQFYLAMVQLIWSIFYNFFVITLLCAGHSIRNEAKYTGVLLHRAINRCMNSEVVGRMLAFSQQINHRIPEASCNLFPFDWTLFYSIAAATATYLIILIQFDASAYGSAISKTNNISFSN